MPVESTPGPTCEGYRAREGQVHASPIVIHDEVFRQRFEALLESPTPRWAAVFDMYKLESPRSDYLRTNHPGKCTGHAKTPQYCTPAHATLPPIGNAGTAPGRLLPAKGTAPPLSRPRSQ